MAHAGEKVFLRWNVSNSTTVASQRILLSPEGFRLSISHAPTDHPCRQSCRASATSLEITIPPMLAFQLNEPSSVPAHRRDRCERATRMGPDAAIIVPVEVSPATFKSHPTTRVRPSSEGRNDTCRVLGQASTNGVVHRSLSSFSSRTVGLFSLYREEYCNLPILSTDSVRHWPFCPRVIRMTSNGSSRTPYFSIRPDPRVGFRRPWCISPRQPRDRPLPGGSVVPITWTASAQQGLRSFDIQVLNRWRQDLSF